MAIKFTAESFLEIVKRSRLLSQDQLQRLLAGFKKSGINTDDSRKIADALVQRNVLTRWQADKLLQGKHKGFFLGKYRLLSLLGKGGMGSVYLAEHTLMRRRCAIKVLPAKRVHDTSYLARFHREAQAVAALDHVNIVRAYDVDKEVEKETEIHFLVMEFVNGRSLLDIVLKDGPIAYVQAADYIRQASDGLDHAHQAGMVHRDIKPGNLLVDESSVVKILDLGLARFFGGDDDESESLTVAHDERVLGTADYLAPEQALDSHSVDSRADIYSLGCTFYFLLTGHPPFTEGTLAQRLMAHQTREPPALENECPDIPLDLLAIIRKMMAKDVNERYQSARDVNEALKNWLLGNADDDWKMRNSALIGSDSSTTHGIKSSLRDIKAATPVAASDVVSADAQPKTSGDSGVPAAAQGVAAVVPAGDAPGDDAHLNAFLANLDSSDTGRQPAASATDAPTSPATSPAAAPIATATPAAAASPALAAKVDGAPPAGSAAGQATGAPPVAQPAAVAEAVPVAATQVTAQPAAPASASESVVPVAQAVPASGETSAESSAEPAQTAERSFARRERKRRSGRGNLAILKPLVGLLQKKQVRLGSAAAGGLVLVALLVYAGISYFGGGGQPPDDGTTDNSGDNSDATATDSTANGGNGTKFVPGQQIQVGPKGTFKSIAEALKYVKENYHPGFSPKAEQVIVVAGGTPYAERIEADAGFPAGIRLVAQEGTRTVLAPTGNGPIIKLDGVTRFTVEGFDLDAQRKPVAVELTGYLNASRLKDLEITGFTQTGILSDGAVGVGAYDQEVHLEQIELRAGAPKAVGMKFQQGTSDTAQIKVRDCRFLGPMSGGIVLLNSPKFVSVRRTIFANLETGVKFDGSNMRLSNITIANCTFFKLDRGVVFTSLPSEASQGLMIARNVFSQLKGVDAIVENDYQVKKFYAMFSHPSNAGTAWNWSSRPRSQNAAAGEVDLFSNEGRMGAKLEFVSTDPSSDRFLAPTAGAEWARNPNTRDQDRPSDDFKPYVGAVGP